MFLNQAESCDSSLNELLDSLILRVTKKTILLSYEKLSAY